MAQTASKHKVARIRSVAVLLGIGLSSSGCQKLAVWLTRSSGAPTAPVVESAAPTPAANSAEALAARARRNAEILQEMYRVVLLQEPASPAEFGSWVDTLNQGATLEGVYAGFSRSDLQRSKEADRRTTAKPQTTRIFATSLASLLLEFPAVPELSEADARPLGTIDPSAGSASPGAVATLPAREEVFKPLMRPADSPQPRPAADQLSNRIELLFSGASIFTQKRVLGEWALKVIELRREESVDRLRGWYADFAAKMAGEKIDFGIPLRNEPSREFHRKWADSAGEDLLRWEVLNRLHRILNASQGAN